jgi:hypothetical protein
MRGYHGVKVEMWHGAYRLPDIRHILECAAVAEGTQRGTEGSRDCNHKEESMKTVMVRTYSAGVFYGKLKARKGKEVTLTNARRVWYWAGAASLSQLANEGTKRPTECKFPAAVAEIVLTEAIEIIAMTAAAVKSLDGVPVWSA